MRFRTGLMLGAALAASCGALPAQAPTPDVSEFTVNGLKVLVKARPSTQSVAAGVFFVGGRRNLTRPKAGVEKLLLEMAADGTKNFPRERLAAEHSRRAIVLGASSNRDYSVVSIRCVRSEFPKAAEILADAVLQPALTPDALARNAASLAERTAPSDPYEVLQAVVDEAIYSGHPYESPEKGTRASLASLKLEDVQEHHRKLLQTSRMLVVVVGNVGIGDVRRWVTESFASIPAGAPLKNDVPPLSFPAPSLQRSLRPLPVNYVQGVFAGPRADGADAAALETAVSILSSRLFSAVRQHRGLAYDASASLAADAASVGAITFDAGNVGEVAPLVMAEIGRLRTTPVADGDLRAAQANLRTKNLIDAQDNPAQAAALARAELLRGGWAKGATPAYERVTVDQVQKAAQTWLKNFQFFMLGPDTATSAEAFAEPAGK